MSFNCRRLSSIRQRIQ